VSKNFKILPAHGCGLSGEVGRTGLMGVCGGGGRGGGRGGEGEPSPVQKEVLAGAQRALKNVGSSDSCN